MTQFIFSESDELRIALSKKMNKITQELYNFRHYMNKDTYQKFITFYESYRGSALSALETEAMYVKEFINEPHSELLYVDKTFENAKNLCNEIIHYSSQSDTD